MRFIMDAIARFVGPIRGPDSWARLVRPIHGWARLVGPIRVGPIRGPDPWVGPFRGPDSWLLHGLYMDAIWLLYGADIDLKLASISILYGVYEFVVDSVWIHGL